MSPARILVAAVLLAWTAPAAAQAPVALVDGAPISRQRLERFTATYLEGRGRSLANVRSPAAYKTLQREALDLLVDEELLVQEGRRRGLAPTAEEARSAMERAQARFELPGAYQAWLAAEGLRESDHAAELTRRLTLDRLVAEVIAPGVRVTDEEAREAYRADPERFRAPPPAGAPPGAAGPLRPEEEVHAQLLEQLRLGRLRGAVRAEAARLRLGAEVKILLPP